MPKSTRNNYESVRIPERAAAQLPAHRLDNPEQGGIVPSARRKRRAAEAVLRRKQRKGRK